MSSVVIRVAGVNITADVIIQDAIFTTSIGTFPGEFSFRVKDPTAAYNFKASDNVTLDIDGVRSFDGYVLQASKAYAFPVVDTTDPQVLMWTLRGPDINILFAKRFVYKVSAPAADIPDFPIGTTDLTALNSLFSTYLDLAGDSITSNFTQVGIVTPDESGLPFNIAETWHTAMSNISHLPGAIWGIKPNRVLYYEDDDTESAPFRLSDTPNNSTTFGYSNMEWTHDGTKLANDSIFWGAGPGSRNMVVSRVQDSASINTHGRWQSGQMRSDIWRQTTATAISTSVVYGTPQNLHGGKDDSEIVTCRIKKPGLEAGDKVHITSNIFGLTKVLPIRQMTMTFPSPTDVLYDLHLSYDIDRPLSFHNWLPIPFPTLPRLDLPEPCGTELGLFTGWLDSTPVWDVARSHPWLGSTYFSGNTTIGGGFDFRPKKRYNQTHGNIFVADYGDGLAGSKVYTHLRSQYIVPPARCAIQFEFQVPYYSFIPGYHLAPFPDFNSGLWWGAGDRTIYPRILLEMEVFGSLYQLLMTANGRNAVNGQFGAGQYGFAFPSNTHSHVPQGTKFRVEWTVGGSGAGIRVWPATTARPANLVNGGNTINGGSGVGTLSSSPEPWNQETYGPNRPWRSVSGGVSTLEKANYIFIRGEAGGDNGEKSFHPGTVIGNPTAANNTIRTNFERFTTGATVGGNTSGYHDALANGYHATMAINSFRFVELPDSFNFLTDEVPNCLDLILPPLAGTRGCELISKSSDTTYVTTYRFAKGSTEVTLEGVAQRLGIDYDENVETHTLVFRDPILSSAQVWCCYATLGSP